MREPAPLGLLAPAVIVRAEGAAMAVLAILLFARRQESWWLFAALILSPDLTIPIYFVNERVGAGLYNAAHTYLFPIVLAGYGVVGDADLPIAVALIWTAHIGVDRALGFGLKYPTAFRDTHLQRL